MKMFSKYKDWVKRHPGVVQNLDWLLLLSVWNPSRTTGGAEFSYEAYHAAVGLLSVWHQSILEEGESATSRPSPYVWLDAIEYVETLIELRGMYLESQGKMNRYGPLVAVETVKAVLKMAAWSRYSGHMFMRRPTPDDLHQFESEIGLQDILASLERLRLKYTAEPQGPAAASGLGIRSAQPGDHPTAGHTGSPTSGDASALPPPCGGAPPLGSFSSNAVGAAAATGAPGGSSGAGCCGSGGTAADGSYRVRHFLGEQLGSWVRALAPGTGSSSGGHCESSTGGPDSSASCSTSGQTPGPPLATGCTVHCEIEEQASEPSSSGTGGWWGGGSWGWPGLRCWGGAGSGGDGAKKQISSSSNAGECCAAPAAACVPDPQPASPAATPAAKKPDLPGAPKLPPRPQKRQKQLDKQQQQQQQEDLRKVEQRRQQQQQQEAQFRSCRGGGAGEEPELHMGRNLMWLAELLYIWRPVVYVTLLKRYGRRSWRPWLASLAVDLLSAHFHRRGRQYVDAAEARAAAVKAARAAEGDGAFGRETAAGTGAEAANAWPRPRPPVGGGTSLLSLALARSLAAPGITTGEERELYDRRRKLLLYALRSPFLEATTLSWLAALRDATRRMPLVGFGADYLYGLAETFTAYYSYTSGSN